MKPSLVKNPLEKLPDILKQNVDKNLCVCNEVVKMNVINAIANGLPMLPVEMVVALGRSSD